MKDSPLTYDEWKQLSKPGLQGEVHLLLDGLQSVENAGLILRTAAALQVEKIYFLEPAFNWESNKIKRLSRSANERISIEMISETDFLAVEQSDYNEVIALEYTKLSASIYKYVPAFPLLLIAGSETKGISQKVLDWAGKAVHIPLFGSQSSINVACALSGALIHINQRRITY